MPDFGREDAISLYNVDRWGEGYFTVNRKGHMVVLPNRSSDQKIDLMEVIAEAKRRKLGFPLTVRFHDLLRDRVETINKAFAEAIETMGYRNVYRGVFPIKVNQLREVVEEILDAGKRWHFGLEAGSKPELMAALALHQDYESLIVCNGYKDTDFVRTALLGRKLGKTVILVVEKVEELTHILKVSAQMKVEPYVGLRVRLLSKGAGKWATSGGENAKFGLATAELVAASDLLTEAGLAHALKLVHFHVGSQVPDIGTIKRATKEAARFYSKLQKMGHEMGYLDVGGGLGVDYDGSRTTFDSSTNYSLNEYARDIVYSIMEVCDAEGRSSSHHRERKRSGDRRPSFRPHRRGLRFDREKSQWRKNRSHRGRSADSFTILSRSSKTSEERTDSRTCTMPTKYVNAPRLCSTWDCSICGRRRKSKPSTGR